VRETFTASVRAFVDFLLDKFEGLKLFQFHPEYGVD